MSSNFTRPEANKLVKLLASYILSDGTHIKVQTRAYRRWLDYLEAMEKKYTISFRSEAITKAMTARAKELASKKLIRGPGSTF